MEKIILVQWRITYILMEFLINGTFHFLNANSFHYRLTGLGIIKYLFPLGLVLARIITTEWLIDIQNPLNPNLPKDVLDVTQYLDKISVGEWIEKEKYLPKDISDVLKLSVIAPFSRKPEQMSALYWWR